MPLARVWLALLLLAATQRAGGAPAGAAAAPEMNADAPGPAPAPADGCPFTLRVAGQLIPVARAPQEARYIIVSAGSVICIRVVPGGRGLALPPVTCLLPHSALLGAARALTEVQACRSMEQRAQLAELMAAGKQGGAGGGAAALAPLTQTMPLLVGNLSRAHLLWLCQDLQASACVDYIERDEKVSSEAWSVWPAETLKTRWPVCTRRALCQPIGQAHACPARYAGVHLLAHALPGAGLCA